MGKHTKLTMPKKVAAPIAAATSTAATPMPASIDAMLEESLAGLWRMSKGAEAALQTENGATPALLRETAALTRAIAAVSAEMRARAKADKERGFDLTHGAVVEWFRTLGRRERAVLLRELGIINAGEPKIMSGLA